MFGLTSIPVVLDAMEDIAWTAGPPGGQLSTSTYDNGAGPFMTEECALIATLEGGGLDVRFLSRRAKVSTDTADVGVMAAGGEPLPIPKKTRLYIEFAKRERENAKSLYHAFQQCAFVPRPITWSLVSALLTSAGGPYTATVAAQFAHVRVRTGGSSHVLPDGRLATQRP
jgi:hypothetical protein